MKVSGKAHYEKIIAAYRSARDDCALGTNPVNESNASRLRTLLAADPRGPLFPIIGSGSHATRYRGERNCADGFVGVLEANEWSSAIGNGCALWIHGVLLHAKSYALNPRKHKDGGLITDDAYQLLLMLLMINDNDLARYALTRLTQVGPEFFVTQGSEKLWLTYSSTALFHFNRLFAEFHPDLPRYEHKFVKDYGDADPLKLLIDEAAKGALSADTVNSYCEWRYQNDGYGRKKEDVVFWLGLMPLYPMELVAAKRLVESRGGTFPEVNTAILNTPLFKLHPDKLEYDDPLIPRLREYLD